MKRVKLYNIEVSEHMFWSWDSNTLSYMTAQYNSTQHFHEEPDGVLLDVKRIDIPIKRMSNGDFIALHPDLEAVLDQIQDERITELRDTYTEQLKKVASEYKIELETLRSDLSFSVRQVMQFVCDKENLRQLPLWRRLLRAWRNDA